MHRIKFFGRKIYFFYCQIYPQKTGNPLKSHYVPSFSVQKEYIEMALTTIDENYGGMDKFLVQQLGVDVEKLRKLYLY